MPPVLNAVIAGYVAGDELQITENITSIPTGRTITKAWFTVKNLKTDADPGLVQKIITTSVTPNVGQITDDGAGDGIGQVVFQLTKTDTGTTLTAGKSYYFDIQLLFDDGSIATIKAGTITFEQGVTAASS